MHATFGLRVVLIGLVLGFLPSCFRVGNDLNGTCTRGKACVCDVVGNCARSCPGGGCELECRGIDNCTFDCEGGGCHAVCENTGNCIVDCEGGGCDVTCMQSAGNCIVNNPEDLSTRDLSAPRDFSSVD
jgi:hypothetical protein